MFVKNFFAHTLIEQAIIDAKNRHYLIAWGKTFGGRISFTAEAVLQIAQLSLIFIKTFFASLEAFYTWGYEREAFDKGVNDFGEKTNQLFLSIFGAVLSPTYAFYWKEKNLLEEAWEITQKFLPNRLNLSPRGASFGWACKSVSNKLTPDSPTASV